ncbi:conserved hypothetical protein [Beggiatoa sp. SS]|nr:conserved hypothetical protein [Beggiatoa sp. SS]
MESLLHRLLSLRRPLPNKTRYCCHRQQCLLNRNLGLDHPRNHKIMHQRALIRNSPQTPRTYNYTLSSLFPYNSPPLTTITKIYPQFKNTQTQHNYKYTTPFPLQSPSYSLLFPP